MQGNAIGLFSVAVLGVGFLVYGLWPPSPRQFPARIIASQSEFRHLYEVLETIDRAGDKGDVPRLRRTLTERYLAETERRMRELGGQELDGMKLNEQGSFLGDMAALRFVHGAGRGSWAVLVFVSGTSDVAGRSLQAFVFDAESGSGRLDDKKTRVLEAGASQQGVAREWAQALLAERP